MTNARTLKRKWLGILTSAAAVLIVLALPGRAFAQSSTGNMVSVEYSFNGGNPQLILQQTDSLFYAPKTPPAGCGLPTITIDTIKTWQAIAQAAKLSGKSTIIYYTACSGANYMNDLVMLN